MSEDKFDVAIEALKWEIDVMLEDNEPWEVAQYESAMRVLGVAGKIDKRSLMETLRFLYHAGSPNWHKNYPCHLENYNQVVALLEALPDGGKE
jgi:hypothetical protein